MSTSVSSAKAPGAGRAELPSWLPRSPDGRAALDRLHRAVYDFSTAERRLRSRNQRMRDALSHGRLRALVFHMVEGEATPGDLAREADVSPATITAMIEQLLAQHVVKRRRDLDDGRVWWISLTNRGRVEVTRLKAEWDQRFAEALADVSDRHVEAASEVLERLSAMFDASGRYD